MMHVHVRRPDGRHLLDGDAYRQAIDAIGKEVGDRLLVQITTESLGLYRPEEQAAVLRDVRPEAASLALREFVAEAKDESAFADLLGWMKRHHVLPQIILYEPSEAVRLAAMIRSGVVPWADVPVLFVFGRYTVSQTSAPHDLLPFLAPGQPRFEKWSVCAFGAQEAACVTTAALLGGHVRVGFENNLHLPDGTIAGGNADLVRVVATAVRELGCLIGDAGTARILLAASE